MEKLNIQMFAEGEEQQEQQEQQSKPEEKTPAQSGGYKEKMRTLSQLLSVDLFSDDGVEQLKTKLAERETTQQELLTKHETVLQEVEQLKSKQARQLFDIEAISLGVDKEKLEDVFVLSKAKQGDLTITDSLKKVLEDYPNTFGRPKNTGGVVKNDFQRGGTDPHKTEEQRYLESSPKVKAWKAKQQKN